jgi:hypothetical protein
MADNARQTGPALEAMYQFILWLVPTLEKFPRAQRFLLGDRMETAALDVLDLLIQATYTRERQPNDRSGFRLASTAAGRNRLVYAPAGCAPVVQDRS